LDVVNGQVVHVVTPYGEVIGHESGWEADGVGQPEEVEQVLDDARADRSPTASRAGGRGGEEAPQLSRSAWWIATRFGVRPRRSIAGRRQHKCGRGWTSESHWLGDQSRSSGDQLDTAHDCTGHNRQRGHQLSSEAAMRQLFAVPRP